VRHEVTRHRTHGLEWVVIGLLSSLPACSEAAGPSETDDASDAAASEVEAPDAATDAAPDAESGDTAAWESGPISVVEEPGSAWHVAIENLDVVARHLQADVALIIDPTNGKIDGRYAGVYVFAGGVEKYDGTYNDTHCSMFVPDRPFMDQENVVVLAAGPTLTVTMTEGSLSQMSDSQFPSDEPFRWQSTWSLEAAGLRLASSGLYYILPPKDGCALTMTDEGGTSIGSLQITSATTSFLKYYTGVRTIGLVSSVVGSLSFATDAEILQVEVPSYPNTGLFELDFDHSIKEKGQSDVHVEVVLPIDG
jgi:hypothetical protein